MIDAKSALIARDKVLPELREGEKVLISTVISNGIYWKGFAILLIALIFLFIAYQLAIFFSLVGIITLIYEYVVKHYLLLVVTNERVLIRRGILLTDMIQLQFSRIESIETQTTLVGQIFGYSTLMISGTGSQLGFIPFVANAKEIQSVANEILQRRDTSSTEYLKYQARVQAEAIADALDEHQESK